MSARVLLTDADRFPLGAADRELLAAHGATLLEVPGHDPAQVAAAGRDAAALLVYHLVVTAELLNGLPACRVVARCGAGYDNIDVEAALARGVTVTYVSDYAVDEVADHALALLLAVARRVVASHQALAEGRWPSYAELGRMHRLRGRTLALVGFGRTARALAARAAALGMQPAAYDPGVPDAAIALAGAEPLAFDALLERADCLSVHVPLTPATTGLLGEPELARMPAGSILVNISRGGIVAEDALAAALRDGHLAGAGLDVFTDEPPAATNPLLRHPAVVATPHSAAFSEEALADVRRTALEDVLRVLAGAAPRHPVPQGATA